MRLLLDTHHFPECNSTIVKSEMPSLLQAGGGSGGGYNNNLSPIGTPDLLTPIGSPPSNDVVVGSPPSNDDGGQAGMSFAQVSCFGLVCDRLILACKVWKVGGGWQGIF